MERSAPIVIVHFFPQCPFFFFLSSSPPPCRFGVWLSMFTSLPRLQRRSRLTEHADRNALYVACLLTFSSFVCLLLLLLQAKVVRYTVPFPSFLPGPSFPFPAAAVAAEALQYHILLRIVSILCPCTFTKLMLDLGLNLDLDLVLLDHHPLHPSPLSPH